MPAERFYHNSPLEAGEQLLFSDAEFHHLKNVMRAKVGDQLEVVNGAGVLATAVVCGLEKKKAIVHVQTNTIFTAPSTQLILIQALPRPNRLDFIVEKGTELGMTELWLFPGERSERKELSDAQLERYNAITVNAMKQSGRFFLPKIILKPALSRWEKPEIPLFYGDVSENAPSFKKLWQEPAPSLCACVIGPESGLTEKEASLLQAWHATGLSLHANILRTDTAAIAALTNLSLWMS